jgi:hypothetical protein
LRERDATTASAGFGQDGAQYSGAVRSLLEVRAVTGLGQIDPLFARRVEEVERLSCRDDTAERLVLALDEVDRVLPCSSASTGRYRSSRTPRSVGARELNAS